MLAEARLVTGTGGLRTVISRGHPGDWGQVEIVCPDPTRW